MQIVHESGHVLAAWLSGATVERVVLLPISRTDTNGVEHPLFVYGADRFVLFLFGLICVTIGLCLWHGQSRFFFPKGDSSLKNGP